MTNEQFRRPQEWKRLKTGLCVTCGNQVTTFENRQSIYCLKHLIAKRENSRQQKKCQRRNTNAMSYQITKINIGDRVFIFETVSGNEYGEYGTVEAIKGSKYIVRAQDGALFSQTVDGIRPVQV